MKNFFEKIAALTGLVVLLSAPLSVTAADYGIAKTFWNVANFTNVTGTATNLAQTADLTQDTDFVLSFKGGFTNAAAGTFDVHWTTSSDNVNFCGASVCAQNAGWFSVPLTNLTAVFHWQTNITVNALGYWRIDWMTNSAGQSLTNITVRAYTKPKRQSSR